MSDIRRIITHALVALLIVISIACITIAQTYDPNLYSGLRWRMIGPFRAGRVNAVSGVIGPPETFYFGSVGGGVWKTVNAGHTWFPIADDPKTGIPIGSIGAIDVAPSNPSIIY